ncbi:MAG: acylglycerol kinase family protein, partial [Hornefia butyriciproducens]|nr:acylglycerol kinase family protein [Hornefia butyriciproducens]
MKRALVIINPCAGTKQANRHFVQITDILCKAGYETVVATTAGRGDGTEIARTRSRKFDLVVCIGGDGTYTEVAAGVIASGTGTPIGYIPAGSTNDFANSLKLSRDIMTAAKDILCGTPQSY